MLGLGGGSNMDLAKITAAVLAHGGTPRDYVGDDQIPGPIFPLICVPTTAGTGSEVSAASVLTDTDNQMKVGILSNYLRPRVALVDPLLTVSCPPKVTADSGIDALTHAIEAYTAVDNETFPLPPGERTVYQGRHPMGDLLAEKAIALVGRHLRRAVADGDDLEAREGMALGATLAGHGVLQRRRGGRPRPGVPGRRRRPLLARRRQRPAPAVRDALQPAGAGAAVRQHRQAARRGRAGPDGAPGGGTGGRRRWSGCATTSASRGGCATSA